MAAVRDDGLDGGGRLGQLRGRLEAVKRIGGLGTWELDLASGALRACDQLRVLLGWEPAAGATFDDLLQRVHPADRDRVAEAHRRAVQDGTGSEVEHRVLCDGGVRRLRQDVAVVHVDGRPARLVGTVLDVTDQVERSRRLLEVESRRRELLHRLVRASEAARAQLAGDLHDGPVQVLTATAMRLEVLARAEPDPPAWLTDALPVVRGVCTQLRDVLFDLHPQVIGVGVHDTVAHLASTVLPGTPVTVHHDGEEPPPAVGRAVLGLVQEAFWDVREHDSADAVVVRITVGDATDVVLDGGAAERPVLSRAGLHGVSERCEALGGTAALDPGGRVLRAALPHVPADAA